MTEYLVVVSLVAVVAIPAFAKLGSSVSSKALSVAKIVEGSSTASANSGGQNSTASSSGNAPTAPSVGSGEAISLFPDPTNPILSEGAGKLSDALGLDRFGLKGDNVSKATGLALALAGLGFQDVENQRIGESGTQLERLQAIYNSGGKAVAALGSIIPSGIFGGTVIGEAANAAGEAAIGASLTSINNFAHYLHEIGAAPRPSFDPNCSFTIVEGSNSVCH